MFIVIIIVIIIIVIIIIIISVISSSLRLIMEAFSYLICHLWLSKYF